MNRLIMIGTLSIALCIVSCKKDENCLSTDAVGTYTGTKECDGMDAVNVSFEVTVGNSDAQIIIDGITTSIIDCELIGSSVVQGTGREIDGDIDGKKISFVETVRVNGTVDFRCTWDGNK